eukprot:Clim_evm82s144 gene=Clim_evmTU82s144
MSSMRNLAEGERQVSVPTRRIHLALIKKLGVPKCTRVSAVAWHKSREWIAMGGDNGMLRVIRLEPTAEKATENVVELTAQARKIAEGNASPTSVAMNSSLEGHKGEVTTVVWNHLHRKLVSADENGCVIVWAFHNGAWYQEMVNDRINSKIRGMCWSADESMICLAWANGLVVVGNRDGDRIWGKTMNDPINQKAVLNIMQVLWHTDDTRLLFACEDGTLLAYTSADGKFLSARKGLFRMAEHLCIDSNGIAAKHSVRCLRQCSGDYSNNVALLLDHGVLVLFHTRTLQDESVTAEGGTHFAAKAVHTGLSDGVNCSWSTDGRFLAITGSLHSRVRNRGGQIEHSKVAIVSLFTADGGHVRSLQLPGEVALDVAWHARDDRLAVSVGNNLFLVNVNLVHRPCVFGPTDAQILSYSFQSPHRTPGSHIVVFFDTVTGKAVFKGIEGFRFMKRAGNLCCVVAERGVQTSFEPQGLGSGEAVLRLYNAIGAALLEILLPFMPIDVSATNQTIVAGSNELVYCCRHRMVSAGSSPLSAESGGGPHDSSSNTAGIEWEALFHIDDQQLQRPDQAMDIKPLPTDNPIVCLAVSNDLLLVARQGGIVTAFSLPSCQPVARQDFRTPVYHIALNCNDTQLALITNNHSLFLCLLDDDLVASVSNGQTRHDEKQSGKVASKTRIGRLLEEPTSDNGSRSRAWQVPDVWDVTWAADDPGLFIYMAKNKLYISRNVNQLEEYLCSGHVCAFTDLNIKIVMLNEILSNPTRPNLDAIVKMDSASLRQCGELLRKASGISRDQDPITLNDVLAFVEKHAHTRLWKLLADESLDQERLDIAQRCYQRSKDLAALRIVKRIRGIDDKMLRRAEIEVHRRRFDRAENLFVRASRPDLAIIMRHKIGDYFRMKLLVLDYANHPAVKESNNGMLQSIANVPYCNGKVGEYLKDRQQYVKATMPLRKAEDYQTLSQCYFMMEDYNEIAKLIVLIDADAAGQKENKPFALTPSQATSLLCEIGHKLASVGMVEDAVRAFEKGRAYERAIASCCDLNRGDIAMELAQKYSVLNVETIFNAYGDQLVVRGSFMQAVDFYRRSGEYGKAALLLCHIAVDLVTKQPQELWSVPLTLKRLYIMAGRMARKFEESYGKSIPGSEVSNLATLIASGGSSPVVAEGEAAGKSVAAPGTNSKSDGDGAAGATPPMEGHQYGLNLLPRESALLYRRAEACHLLGLLSRLLLDHQFKAAYIVSCGLHRYPDFLPETGLCVLHAISAYASGNISACHGALFRARMVLRASGTAVAIDEQILKGGSGRHRPAELLSDASDLAAQLLGPNEQNVRTLVESFKLAVMEETRMNDETPLRSSTQLSGPTLVPNTFQASCGACGLRATEPESSFPMTTYLCPGCNAVFPPSMKTGRPLAVGACTPKDRSSEHLASPRGWRRIDGLRRCWQCAHWEETEGDSGDWTCRLCGEQQE